MKLVADEVERWRAQLEKCPDHPEALSALGGRLQLEGRYDDAATLAWAALAKRANCSEALTVLGDAMVNSGRLQEALIAYRDLLKTGEMDAEAYLRLARVYRTAGDAGIARVMYDCALTARPGWAAAIYGRGILWLGLGEYREGWRGYESRWDWDQFTASGRGSVSYSIIPHLTRSPTKTVLRKKRVLLIGEQGLGDQVMFASMFEELSDIAESVLCLCNARLINLFASSFPKIQFQDSSDARIAGDAIDLLIAMGSLGNAFRICPADFTGKAFLTPSYTARARWVDRLGPAKKMRIGISWRGGVPLSGGKARSIDLPMLAPLLAMPDYQFVSLQHGAISAEVEAFNASSPNPITQFPAEDLADLDDLAALIDCLDLVVSVDNTNVQLAGALGKTCLALLPTATDWRYQHTGDKMPWYGSVRLFRQPSPNEWAPVIASVVEAVNALG